MSRLRRDEVFLRLVLILAVFGFGWSKSSTTQTNVTRTASACYGNVNSWLRLECEGELVIRVTGVTQGAKMRSAHCVTPATQETYQKNCCHWEPTDCTIEVQNVLGETCDGHPQCHFVAMWSFVSQQCDQDKYYSTTSYMRTEYACVQPPSTPATTQDLVTSANSSESVNTNPDKITTPRTTKLSITSRPFVVVSKEQDGEEGSEEELSNAMLGAILAGSLGMVLTFVIFVFYWRRKRRLRIIGKPQTTVWDYLLNQTFTVRGERGYDHFSSCRSSASSDGDNKSPVIRRSVWLPNIPPSEDSQSDVFNDSQAASHTLEFRQVGTANPYAFLSLGVGPAGTNDPQQQHA